MNTKQIPISVAARLIYHLGEQLISDELVALLELIKNAYDADATKCIVTVDSNADTPFGAGEITITDNGNGMLPHTVTKDFLRLATSYKKENKVSPYYKRRTLGEKGLGRLSYQRLGKCITVTTIARRDRLVMSKDDYQSCVVEDNNCIEITMNWDGFSDDASINDVYATVVERHVCKPLAYGTTIKIQGIRNNSFWQLHNRVADSLIGYSAYHINELLGSFAIETQRRLDEIAKNLTLASLETLNYNMNFEGSTNIYCAFREIQSLLQEKQYTSRFSECAPYISAMKKMRVPTGSEESLVKSNISRFLKAFEWTKFQILHSDCNNSFADIAYGDLFRLHQDDQCYIGIVVTQSCDCVLRKASNGTVSRNALSFSMILYPEKIEIIHSLSDLQFSNETIRKLRDCGVIYSLEGNESSGYTMKYIRTDETHGRIAQFKPFILDLASLNPEGFCAVGNIDNILDIVKQEKVEVWSKYGQVLLNEVRAARNRIQTLSDRMGEEAGEIIEDLYGVPFDLQNQSFKMQRVGQLTPNLVELVYRGFLSHFYRVGRNPVTALQTDG